jgi:hypothetical protein
VISCGFSEDFALCREKFASAGRRITGAFLIFKRQVTIRCWSCWTILTKSTRGTCAFSTQRSHHANISVILITQNLFHQGRFSSYISRNTKYLVVFKNVHDTNQLAYHARHVYPEDSNGLYESYLDATRRPHGYLLLHRVQDQDNCLQFRTDVFPSEITVVAPVSD